MKKIISIFLLVVGVFTFNGCSGKSVETDVSSLVYLDNSSKENIAYNLEMVASNIKGVSFDGVLKFKEKSYSFSGEIIVRDSLKNSLVHINYKDNNFYLKDGNLYLSYMYNNTNVVIKDNVDNFSKEVISLLKNKNVKINEEKVYTILNEKWIDDINFSRLSEMVQVTPEGFVIDYKGSVTVLNEKYLPTSFELSKGNFELKTNFKYEPVSISVPLGYDLINTSISSIKGLLRVDNLSELIK